LSDKIKENEIGRACSTHREEERCIQVGNLEGSDHFGDLGVDGKIILEWIFKQWDGGSMD
jgi:hypothetical protein